MSEDHTSTVVPIREPLVLARFLAKLQCGPASTCWIWTASQGYGHFNAAGRRWVYAHRFAYAAWVGPIPAGLILDHLCRTRACCNPAHLEPVSTRENILRGTGAAARNARKTHCRYGHRLPRSESGARPCRDCGRRYRSANLERVRVINRRAMARYRALYPERVRESQRRYRAQRAQRGGHR